MAKFMAEIGLTPASRSRLAIVLEVRPKLWEFGAEGDDPDEFFN